jgi:hypothetical protein
MKKPKQAPRSWPYIIEHIRGLVSEAGQSLKDAEQMWIRIFDDYTDDNRTQPKIWIDQNKNGKAVIQHTLCLGDEPAWDFERDFAEMLDECLEVKSDWGDKADLARFADTLHQVQQKCAQLLALREKGGW